LDEEQAQADLELITEVIQAGEDRDENH
jgi:hypothetical protein